MWKYTIKRLIGLIPVLIIVALITFLLIHLTPGDPAQVMLGTESTPERVADLRAEMGLDKPLYIQFEEWLINVLHGDLGRSIFLDRPVTQALLERLPATFLLAITSLIIAVVIGIPLGVIASSKPGSILDGIVMTISLIGVSVPSFWLGLLLIILFSVVLGWLPSGGYCPLNENFLKGLSTLIMPSFSLGFMQAALIARMTRSSMLEIISLDYIRTARAKGLSEYVIFTMHAFKNIRTKIITVVGLAFGVLLGGAVIVETVFSYPGVGRLVVQAVTRRDYPLIQGTLLIISCSYVFVNLIVDLLYPLFDPRIKYS